MHEMGKGRNSYPYCGDGCDKAPGVSGKEKKRLLMLLPVMRSVYVALRLASLV